MRSKKTLTLHCYFSTMVLSVVNMLQTNAEININIFCLSYFFTKELLPSISSFSRLTRFSFLSVFLMLPLVIISLLTNGLFYFPSQLFFSSAFQTISDIQVNSLSFPVLDSVVFASIESLNSSENQNDSLDSSTDDNTITLKALLTDLGEKGRWESLLEKALEKLRSKYPNKHISLEYKEYLTNDTRDKFLQLMSNKSSVDIVSVDQIWLGEFASKKLLSNLTGYVDKWGRATDWYQEHWDGGTYNSTIYGILTWTDVRGIWYWKDLLRQAQVNEADLKSWQGYIDSAQKLNQVLTPTGVNGTVLFDTYYSQDMWFPYLWMLGGDIVQLRGGHPTKGTYWFPIYNGTEGIQALGFIRDQIDAGIKPDRLQTSDRDEFAQKRIAMMIGGSWMPGFFADQKRGDFESKIGLIPMFPVPSLDKQSSTLMGGWELAIPITSNHKALAWEFIAALLDPAVLGPWIQKYGYLPTQIPLGQGLTLNQSSSDLPYYDTLISMIPLGDIRPSIPEYPVIAGHINEAIDRVYYSNSTDLNISSVLNEAALKSARALGW